MRKTRFLGAAAALTLLGAIGVSQIKSMTLAEMVTEADNAVYGEITSQHVFVVDHPVDGPELYFTTLSIDGRLVGAGTPVSVEVTFRGGFLDDEHGVFNSEAPAADDVKVGNRVVVFYKWLDDMGGGVAANALMCAHGGLYRTMDGPKGTVVLGRGKGYAISSNTKVEKLDEQVRSIKR
ncbi:MAG: hypothetical protein AB1726_10140 [Planctomycetota bacterium]